MTRAITVEERRARLARRHRLLPEERTDDVTAIADDLVALHSSDPVTVYLSLWARMRTPSVAAVEQALYGERTLVRHHAMRRTLWVATPGNVRLMHAAATRKVAAAERRRLVKILADNGVADPERWLAVAVTRVLAVLHEHGPLGARRIGELAPELRVPLELGAGSANAVTVAAHTRVLVQMGFEGEVVRTRPHGTWVSGQYAYAAADTWLEGGLDTHGLTEREAAALLAERWLRRFGPATTADLQWWTGWTATLTRHALVDCGAVPVDLDGEPGWVAEGDEEPAEPAGDWVALLPGLDPTTMGWKQRGWYLPGESADAFDRNGNAGPTIWADGRIVGAWVQTAEGEIRTHYFLDVPDRTRRQVDSEVQRLATLLGEDRHSVRFPGMQHQRLLAR